MGPEQESTNRKYAAGRGLRARGVGCTGSVSTMLHVSTRPFGGRACRIVSALDAIGAAAALQPQS